MGHHSHVQVGLPQLLLLLFLFLKFPSHISSSMELKAAYDRFPAATNPGTDHTPQICSVSARLLQHGSSSRASHWIRFSSGKLGVLEWEMEPGELHSALLLEWRVYRVLYRISREVLY